MDQYLTRRAHRARLVRDALRDRVLDGRYAAGTLPSEDQLAAEFDVGRNVVREALGLLVAERLLRRAQGVGTRPVSHVVVHELNTLRAIAEEGGAPEAQTVTYRHLTWREVPATAALAPEFGLPTGAPLVLWERLTMGPEPIVAWTSYLPADLGLGAPEPTTPSAGGGTFAFLEQQGVAIGLARVRTGAGRADAGVAELLEVQVGDPVLVQHRRTYTPRRQLIELATGYYRHDRIYLVNDYERTGSTGA